MFPECSTIFLIFSWELIPSPVHTKHPLNETMVFCRHFPHSIGIIQVVFSMNGGWDYNNEPLNHHSNPSKTIYIYCWLHGPQLQFVHDSPVVVTRQPLVIKQGNGQNHCIQFDDFPASHVLAGEKKSIDIPSMCHCIPFTSH